MAQQSCWHSPSAIVVGACTGPDTSSRGETSGETNNGASKPRPIPPAVRFRVATITTRARTTHAEPLAA